MELKTKNSQTMMFYNTFSSKAKCQKNSKKVTRFTLLESVVNFLCSEIIHLYTLFSIIQYSKAPEAKDMELVIRSPARILKPLIVSASRESPLL